jgi:hypothetical protein
MKGPHSPFPRLIIDSTLISLSLSLHTTARCLPWGVHGEISASRVAMAIPETLHNIMSVVKKKIVNAAETWPEVSTLTVIPLRKGSGPAPGGGTAAESRTLRIRVSTSAALSSPGEGRS